MSIDLTIRNRTCVGCGACAVACPASAIAIEWTRRSEFTARVDVSACTQCGLCEEVCPHTPAAIRADADRLSVSDPWLHGLDGADCWVAWDEHSDRRRRSASGGAVSAIVRGLFDRGRIDAVVHAEALEARRGAPHACVVVSRSAREADLRRGSLYHPLSYRDTIEALPGTSRRVAVVGVPCATGAIRRLWRADARLAPIELTTIALACSHNVSGRFVDLLADEAGVAARETFAANLRWKDGRDDANNFRIRVTSRDRELSCRNRFASVFTGAWRDHWFALGACHFCGDFWGADADLSVKDAWGPWASDPLGKSIVVARSAAGREAVAGASGLACEPLGRDVAARSQPATIAYKLEGLADRIARRPWHRSNRERGYLRYVVASAASHALYGRTGFEVTTRLVGWLTRVLGGERGPARPAAPKRAPAIGRLRRALSRRIRAHRRPVVVCWGTGAMGRDVAEAIGDRIAWFVDPSPDRQQESIGGREVRPPSALRRERPADLLILVASMFEPEVRARLAALPLDASARILPVAAIHARACRGAAARARLALSLGSGRVGQLASRLRSFAGGRRPAPRYRRILVVGGYGYRNAGDEAQLHSTLASLAVRFPDHQVKVLTPSLGDTRLLHDRCDVGEAPRLAFYDADRSSLYSLRTPGQKGRFLVRSLWILANAWLVRAGLPLAFLRSRRLALLHEIATSELVYFSGGGYLTGRTLSRLWEGAFLVRIARALGTPVAMSGQTVGVWNSAFTRRLAGWGLRGAALVATRDGDASPAALDAIGMEPSRVLVTCDDALLDIERAGCDRLAEVLRASGLDPALLDQPYVVFNAHDWGIAAGGERRWLIDRLEALLTRIDAVDPVPVIGLPMVASDSGTLADLERARPAGGFRALAYDCDFRVARALIAQSRVCVSMKHHPLVFAMGESVPSISLARGDYYVHKNVGALGLVGMADCSVDLDQADFADRFESIYRRLVTSRAETVDRLTRALPSLRARRETFFAGVASVLGVVEGGQA